MEETKKGEKREESEDLGIFFLVGCDDASLIYWHL